MAAEVKPDRLASILWLVFSGSLFISAFLMPAFIFLLVFGPALGLVPDVLASGRVGAWLASPLVKLFWIFGGLGTIYHGLHRLKYVIYDYGGHRHKAVTDTLAYSIVAMGVILILYLVIVT